MIRSSRSLEQILNQFTRKQLELIMQNIGAIQLTEGCSIGCYFCGFGAEKGVTDYIQFKTLEKLTKRFSEQLHKSKPFLYHASDPFDYDFDGHNYMDVHDLFKKIGNNPFISTAVPKGKEDMVLELLLEPPHDDGKFSVIWNKSVIDRVSISNMNSARLEKAIKKRFPMVHPAKQKTLPYVAIPGKDAFYSIFTDENSDILKKTLGEDIFRRAYYGIIRSKDICISKEPISSTLYMMIIHGDKIIFSPDRPVSYIDVINAYMGNEDDTDNYVFLPGYPQPMRLGEQHSDNLSSRGIACFNGVLMTPKGVYNLHVVPPTKEQPYGFTLTTIDPNNFEVIWLDRAIPKHHEKLRYATTTLETTWQDKLSRAFTLGF
ncbi:MAG: hypothetical protein ABIJ08_04950 [Nanoarchaeota archaeon]